MLPRTAGGKGSGQVGVSSLRPSGSRPIKVTLSVCSCVATNSGLPFGLSAAGMNSSDSVSMSPTSAHSSDLGSPLSQTSAGSRAKLRLLR